MAYLSLRQAAEEAGTSKSTIWRAIRAGRLSAARTDDGGFAIDPAELFRVYQPKRRAQTCMGQDATAPLATREPDATGGTEELALKLAILGDQVKTLRELLAQMMSREEARLDRDDLRHNRDHWRLRADRAGPVLEGTEPRHWFTGRASPAR